MPPPRYATASISIRQADDADALDVGAIFDAAVRDGWTHLGNSVERPMFAPTEWQALVQAHVREGSLLVAVSPGGALCGFCAVKPDSGEVFLLFVHPDHGNRGVGRRLLQAGHDLLRGAGNKDVFLFTHDADTRARDVYAAAGYRPDGATRSSEFRGVPIREVRLVLSLERTSERQGELWSADPDGWATYAEPRLRPLYEQVLARLDVRRGQRFLDAGCGAGLAAALAADAGAVVSGLDAAPALIAKARARLPGATLAVGDLESLPYEDECFDRVTAFNSVPYAARPDRALRELARVLAPGGRLAVTVGSGEASAACAARIEVLLPPDAVASRRSLELADEIDTHRRFEAAGLEVLGHGELSFEQSFVDLNDAVRAQLPAGPVQAATRHSGLATTIAALEAFFNDHTAPDGTVCMASSYWFVVAEKRT